MTSPARLPASAVAAFAALALALPASAGSFSKASYGQRVNDRVPLRLRLDQPDGKTLGFSLASAQQVTVYAGTAFSAAPLQGACGEIARSGGDSSVASSSGSQSGNIDLTWAAHQRGNGRAAPRFFDCGYTGSLEAGDYAVSSVGRFQHFRGPAVVPAAGGQLTSVSATGPANDMRLSFVNNDAAAASITATEVNGTGSTGTLVVKLYRYAARSAGAPGGVSSGSSAASDGGSNGGSNGGAEHQKRGVIKANADDPQLRAMPLEPGAAYTVIVRGRGAERRGTVVLTVTAADAASSTATSAPPSSGGDGSSASGGGDGSSVGGGGDGSTGSGGDAPTSSSGTATSSQGNGLGSGQ